MSSLPRRATLATLLAVAVTALAPGAASADDAAMKAAIQPALAALLEKERAVVRAIRKVERRGNSAVAAAQRRTRAAAKAARTFAGLLLGQQPSSPTGQAAKDELLRGLTIEARAYRTLSRGLRAGRAGNDAKARRLIRRAGKGLRQAFNAGKKAIEMLATIPG